MTVESQLPGNAFGNVNPFSFVDPAGVEEVDGLVARVVLRSLILHAFCHWVMVIGFAGPNMVKLKMSFENIENACKSDLF